MDSRESLAAGLSLKFENFNFYGWVDRYALRFRSLRRNRVFILKLAFTIRKCLNLVLLNYRLLLVDFQLC